MRDMGLAQITAGECLITMGKAEDVQKLIRQLKTQYKYKAIPPMFAEEYHALYRAALPAFLQESGSDESVLCDKRGMEICLGYRRIVIGDYGPYIEFDDNEAAMENLEIQYGQDYRIDNAQFVDRVKYEWWTTKSGSHVKLYRQKRCVEYADYRPGFWYVSPFEVQQKKEE